MVLNTYKSIYIEIHVDCKFECFKRFSKLSLTIWNILPYKLNSEHNPLLKCHYVIVKYSLFQ